MKNRAHFVIIFMTILINEIIQLVHKGKLIHEFTENQMDIFAWIYIAYIY